MLFRSGEFLAEEHPVDADVVIGVPDSGLDAATGYARKSGIPYEMGILKNKYIGRTFIVPGQKNRENMVRIKLNPIESVLKDKKIVLVDDSIVRGTTLQRLVTLVREAGAKEIHLRISSPPFICPCFYGTDVDSPNKLIACRHNNNIRISTFCSQIFCFCMTKSYGSIFLHQHYCQRKSYHRTSSNHRNFSAGYIKSVIVKHFHNCCRCTRCISLTFEIFRRN